MKQLLARIPEVLAQMVCHLDAALLELAIEDLLHQRSAAAAASCRAFVSFFSAPSLVRSPAATASQIRPLLTLLQRHISAVAGSISTPSPFLRPTFARRAGSNPPGAPDRATVQRHLQEGAVIRGVADQMAPSRCLRSPVITSFL